MGEFAPLTLDISPKPFDSKRPWKTSPTQHETWNSCQRKWALTYIAAQRPPTSPSQALGSAIHKVLEDWLEKKKPPNGLSIAEKIAAAGLKYLPLPSDQLQVERSVEVSLKEGLWGGKIDLLDLQNHQIIDHKTTKDFRYQKTVEDLQNDPQAVGYGYWAITELGWPEVKQKWIYYLTKGTPQARVTEFTMSAAELRTKWQQQEKIAEEIIEAWNEHKHPIDYKPNYSACDAYGGCYFRNICQKYKREKEEMTSNPAILAALKERQQKKSPVSSEVPELVQINPPKIKTEEAQEKPKSISVPRKKKAAELNKEEMKTVEQVAPQVLVHTSNEAFSVGLGYNLYVNCLPTKNVTTPIQNLHEIMGPAAQSVLEAYNQRWELTDYGKGPALLKVAFEEKVIPTLSGNIYVDRFSDEGKALLSVLETYADSVVKGF